MTTEYFDSDGCPLDEEPPAQFTTKELVETALERDAELRIDDLSGSDSTSTKDSSRKLYEHGEQLLTIAKSEKVHSCIQALEGWLAGSWSLEADRSRIVITYGTIIEGPLKDKLDALRDQYPDSAETINNDLVRQHIESFSQRPDIRSLECNYSLFIEKILGMKVLTTDFRGKEITEGGYSRIQVSFDASVMESDNSRNLNTQEQSLLEQSLSSQLRSALGMDAVICSVI